MPLKFGYSRETVAGNRNTLEREGYSSEQANAIAYAAGRVSYFRRHPHGALPTWLALPRAYRLRQYYGKHGKPLHVAVKNPLTDKPLAAKGLTSYRYSGTYGWIMIGAKDHADALREANRSLSTGKAVLEKLQIWDGKKYVPVLKNPSLRASVRQAARLGEAFSGHAYNRLVKVRQKPIRGARVAIGPVSGIMYLAKRDGQVEQYLHKFAPRSRPLLLSSSDGTRLELLGGAFRFTDRGIVDRKVRIRGG